MQNPYGPAPTYNNNTNSYPQPYPNYNNPSSPNTIPQNNYYNSASSQNNLTQQPNSADAGYGSPNTYGAKYDNKGSNYGYNVQQQPQGKSNCCDCCIKCMNSQ